MTDPLGTVAVGVFFLMSGYGLEYSYMKKGDGYLRGFLRKRVWKLLLPFLVVVVLWNVEVCFLYPDDSLWLRWIQIKKGYQEGILPFFWYVAVVMMFYVVFWLSYRLLKSETKRFLAIVVVWVIWFEGRKFLNWPPFWFDTSHMFFAGLLYCKFEKQIRRSNAYVWLAAVLFGAVLGSTVNNPYSGMLFNTSFSFLLVCGITLFEHRSKALDFMGKISYEMYLLQALPIFALKDSGLHPAFIIVLTICIDILLAYMLHLLLAKIGKRTA